MREEMPFFDLHYLDLLARAMEREQEELRSLTTLQLGVDETRKILARHNNYLVRYAADPARLGQAGWLVALAGCTANNDASPKLFQQALDMGVSVEDLAEIGLVSNSRHCARFLNEQGVDWKALHIICEPDAASSSNQDINAPINSLVDHLIDPANAHKTRIRRRIGPVHMVATGSLSFSPVAFMEGVMESGQFPGDFRVGTHALGLKDGQAYWLSHCIASGHLRMALACLRTQAPLPQAVLDEALLAVAMSMNSQRSRLTEDEKDLDRLAEYLHAHGANPDKHFEFGFAATEVLRAKMLTRDDGPTMATTREWALFCALQARPSPAWERAMFPNPWPTAPQGNSWLDLVLEHHWPLLDESNHDAIARVMRRLIDGQAKLGLPALLDKLTPHIERQAACHEFTVLRALLASKPGKRAEGSLAPEYLIALLCRWGSDRDNQNPAQVARHIHNWWKSEHLKNAANWLPQDARDRFMDRVGLLCQAHATFEKGGGSKEANAGALVLAFASLLDQAQDQSPVPRAQRRSL